MRKTLESLFFNGFELRIKQSEIYNQAEIKIVDIKNQTEEIAILPIDHHLDTERLIDCVDFLQNKILNEK